MNQEAFTGEQQSVAAQVFIDEGAGKFLAAIKRVTNKAKKNLEELRGVASEGIEVFVPGKQFDDLTADIPHSRGEILEAVGLQRIEEQTSGGKVVSRIEFIDPDPSC